MSWLKPRRLEFKVQKYQLKAVNAIINSNYNYIVLAGGRAAGKTHVVYLTMIYNTYFKKTHQALLRSTKDGARGHSLIGFKQKIEKLGLAQDFILDKLDYIENKLTRARIIPLSTNNSDPNSNKNKEYISLAFIDEAQQLGEDAFIALRATLARNDKEYHVDVTEKIEELDDRTRVYCNLKKANALNVKIGNKLFNILDKTNEYIDIDKVGRDFKSLTYKIATSKIILCMNPEDQNHFLYKDIYKKYINNPDDSNTYYVEHYYYYQNIEAMSNSAVLKDAEESKERGDYEHLYLGEPKNITDFIFNSKRYSIVDEIVELETDRICYGIDFGFSKNPFVCLRCFIRDDIVYITHEAVLLNLSLVDTVSFCIDKMPSDFPYRDNVYKPNTKIFADSASPSCIDFLAKDINVEGCKKVGKSIQDGVNWLLTKTIVIHSRCSETISNFRNYRFKKDRYDNLTNVIEDANNDCIDALRYALQEYVQNEDEKYRQMYMGLINKNESRY